MPENQKNLYTTGEIAKLCGVSVRTVQYYDTRNILVPSELSEGGRRLYSDEDVKMLRIICFLRDMDIPINSIGELFREDDPGNVISILLDRQEADLRKELRECEKKLALLEGMKKNLTSIEHFSVESIGDIAHIMESRKKMRRIRCVMLTVGIVCEIIELIYLFFGILKGIWWPFAVGFPIVVTLAVLLSWYYYKKICYICPKCHTVFKPKFKEMFWAAHTPTTRKLTCTLCGHRGYCVEVPAEEGEEK